MTYALLFRLLRLPRPLVRKVVTERDLVVPMADGVRLLADRWHPAGAGDAPLLLVRTPYGRRRILGQLYGRFFSQQGFQVVVVACRGTDGSGDEFTRPFATERQDGADTVAWLRSQPFYPGTVATIGGSYLGYTQIALPAEAKADLWGAVLQIAPASVREVTWSDGAFALHTALGWSASVSQPPLGLLRGARRTRGDSERLLAAGRKAPLVDSHVEVTGERIGFFQEWLSHPDADDPYWEPLDQYDGVLGFPCPVLVQSGWYDQFLESSVEQYRRLHEAGRPVRMSIGPYNHATFPTKGARDAFTEAAGFLRGLAGLDAAPATSGVSVGLIGERRTVMLPTWPATVPELRLPLPTGAGSTTVTYDPADPTPSAGGFMLDGTGGPKDQAPRESRPDVAVFDLVVDPSRTEVVGACEVELWLDAEGTDTQLVVRLCVVDAKGVSRNVTERVVTLRAGDRGSDGTWHVRTALPPTALSLAGGKRLRLQVSGGAYPYYARCPGTGEPVGQATTFVANRITVHHNEDRPSALLLPEAPPQPSSRPGF